MAQSPCSDEDYTPISDYGIVGDCNTAALISPSGSIDWYCPLRFDRGAVFCRLLDRKRGGRLQLRPSGEFSTSTRYRGETNILQTLFTSTGAKVRVTDFMPVHRRTSSRHGHDVGGSRRILKLVEGLSGDMEMVLHFHPTPDFARERTDVKVNAEGIAVCRAAGWFLSLSPVHRTLKLLPAPDGGVRGSLKVKAGNRFWLVLTDSDDPDRVLELPTQKQCDEQLDRTARYWDEWSSRCTYRGPYRNEVIRSALLLKLLIYEPTGAIVAAPTTSLPEHIGGVRNWDYRYAWLRDASLILYALVNIGYRHEASDFFEWLQRIHHNDPDRKPQVLYGVGGEKDLPETVLDHLEGYRCSSPVRVGNAATRQFQLDIYGEVLTAADLYFCSGMGNRDEGDEAHVEGQRLLEHDWKLLRGFVDLASDSWKEPDSGIWEIRGGRNHYVYSKLMCWVALDRGIRLSRKFKLPAPVQQWEETREEIRRAILEQGYNDRVGAFVQTLGSSNLDASALAIPRVGFLSATDARMRSTVDRLAEELTSKGLVYRYRSEDGLPGTEATFLLCSFWMVDALAMGGRIDEAHDLFERVCGYASNLGLFSEEIHSETGGFLGNFPQGFTHMALINSAVNLAKVTKHGPEEEPETETQRTGRAGRAASERYRRRSRKREP